MVGNSNRSGLLQGIELTSESPNSKRSPRNGSSPEYDGILAGVTKTIADYEMLSK
jgi:hypothetical protein